MTACLAVLCVSDLFCRTWVQVHIISKIVLLLLINLLLRRGHGPIPFFFGDQLAFSTILSRPALSKARVKSDIIARKDSAGWWAISAHFFSSADVCLLQDELGEDEELREQDQSLRIVLRVFVTLQYTICPTRFAFSFWNVLNISNKLELTLISLLFQLSYKGTNQLRRNQES